MDQRLELVEADKHDLSPIYRAEETISGDLLWHPLRIFVLGQFRVCPMSIRKARSPHCGYFRP